METIKTIQKIGKGTRIGSRIINVFFLAIAILVLGLAITATCLPADYLTVDGQVGTVIDINSPPLEKLFSNNAQLREGNWADQLTGADKDNVYPFPGGVSINDDGWLVTVDGQQINLNGEVESFHIELRGIALLLYLAAFSLLLLSAVFWFAARFGLVLEQNESPFVRDSVRALKQLGFAVLAWTVGASIASGIVGWWLAQYAGGVLDLNCSFSLASILIALLFLALAYVFDYGVRLQDEADATL